MIGVSYQTQCKVEERRAAVEQDGEESGRGGDEEADVPAHYHPQRLQDLQNAKGNSKHVIHRKTTFSSTAAVMLSTPFIRNIKIS